MSVGETLARARQERALSVEDVSAVTRIRGGLIRAIENDDFGPCGGAVYARGHIRSIGHVVGIDPEPLVAEFDRAYGDESIPVVPTPAADPAIVARADRKAPNWTAAMAVALVAICLVAAVGLLTGRHHTPRPTANDTGSSPVHTTTPPPSPTSAPPPSAVAQLPSTSAIALIRVTGDRTWLSVETLSGRLLFQGLLNNGQSRVFRDDKGLRLVIGNAPAVDLVADGRELGAPKSSGNVARLTIQPGGAVQYA